MSVPFLDLARRDGARSRPSWTRRSRACSTAAATSSSEEVERFEARRSPTYCGAAHAVGVASGTDAITIALLAAGVGAGRRGDHGAEHAASRRSSGSSAPARRRCSPTSTRRPTRSTRRRSSAASRRARGRSSPCTSTDRRADLGALLDAGRANAAFSWSRTALSRTARRSTAAGRARSAQAAAFSFYPTKNLGALGDGGARRDRRIPRSRSARGCSATTANASRFEHVLRGLNSRLDAIQAAVLAAKLRPAREANAQRRALAAIYDEASPAPRSSPRSTAPGREHAYHLYVVQSADRDAFRRRLESRPGSARRCTIRRRCIVQPAYRSSTSRAASRSPRS